MVLSRFQIHKEAISLRCRKRRVGKTRAPRSGVNYIGPCALSMLSQSEASNRTSTTSTFPRRISNKTPVLQKRIIRFNLVSHISLICTSYNSIVDFCMVTCSYSVRRTVSSLSGAEFSTAYVPYSKPLIGACSLIVTSTIEHY